MRFISILLLFRDMQQLHVTFVNKLNLVFLMRSFLRVFHLSCSNNVADQDIYKRVVTFLLTCGIMLA